MKKYGAILIDPPWAFKTFNKEKGTTPHRGAHDHYPTMQAHELAGLPMPDLAAKDATVFMWAVDSHLEEALLLFRIWGFQFKTIVFVWEKGRIGMGYWTRKQAEVCLLGTKGRPARRDKGVRQLISAPRREHSRKPDEVRERIEKLVDGPYLEMFARQSTPGWDTWGDETEKFDITAEDVL